MAFRADQLRLERLQTEVHYHSAYNFLSLKGALAERWAHGPVFGAFADLGQHVVLSPASDSGERIQGSYGLKSAALDVERVERRQEARDLTENWLGDVLAVLQPKRTVRMSALVFGLYPIENPDQASRLLRDEFFQSGKLNRLKPERFASYHSALNGLLLLGDTQTSYVLGAVGPPHKGTFSASPTQAATSAGRWAYT